MTLETQIETQASTSPLPAAGNPATAGASADAVDRILAYTESAVASIARRTEHQVRKHAAELDAQVALVAAARSAELAELRRALTNRASALAIHYEEILDQLDSVEAALTALSEVEPGEDHRSASEERVTAIRSTLHEHRRVAPVPEPGLHAVAGPSAPTVVSISPAPVPGEPRRRWWHLWQREAA